MELQQTSLLIDEEFEPSSEGSFQKAPSMALYFVKVKWRQHESG
jgi:hypothetical protein